MGLAEHVFLEEDKVEDQPDREHVALLGVPPGSVEHLGRRVQRGPGNGVLQLVLELLHHAEVPYLGSRVLGYQHVVRLQVPVHKPLLVDVVHPLQDLPKQLQFLG